MLITGEAEVGASPKRKKKAPNPDLEKASCYLMRLQMFVNMLIRKPLLQRRRRSKMLASIAMSRRTYAHGCTIPMYVMFIA